jgi:predicted nucleic acid-binding protein
LSAILVDSNVLIDVLTADATWGERSATALSRLADEAVLVINPVIYAELAVGFPTVEGLDDALPTDLLRRDAIPYAAAFLAGKAFQLYRRRGGPRRSPLPDFFIGAHAAVAGYQLLTRDPGRYRTYFPRLELLSP